MGSQQDITIIPCPLVDSGIDYTVVVVGSGVSGPGPACLVTLS